MSLGAVIDGHVHSQFSWDATGGSMEGSCRRAAALGLAGLAFTEHVDRTAWHLPPGTSVDPDLVPHLRDETVRLPALDLEGYLAEIDGCRRRHPALRILSGVEMSEPHWHEQAVAELIADGRLGRVIGSVHAVAIDGDVCEVGALVGVRPAAELVREYLAEVRRMVESVEVPVLAHIDYAARSWPEDGDGFNVLGFEREHRAVLAALAERGGALEVNTSRPLEAVVVEWWIAEGGRSLTFGSDSHAPDTVGAGLASAVHVAERLGFAPQDDPAAPWVVE